MKKYNYTYRLICLLIIGLSFVMSCKKDTKVAVPVTIDGLWSGNYSDVDTQTQLTLDIKPDFTVNVTEGGANGIKSVGSWTLNADAFELHFKEPFPGAIELILAGTFDASSGKIIGTWGVSPSKTNGGNWQVQKQ